MVVDMDMDRINEIIDNATDLRSIYDKLTEEELKGMSFEDFKKMVAEPANADSDEELSDEQMEAVVGGVAGIDDLIDWIGKKGKGLIKKIADEIDLDIPCM